MIKEIEFDVVVAIWEYLHRDRKHIPYSDMSYLGGHFKEKPEHIYYFGYYIEHMLVGVNSCHETDKGFRSRGLYVCSAFRNKGIGISLLNHTIDVAFKHSNMIWSFPKKEALSIYQRAGFVADTELIEADYGMNCYVSRKA